MNPERFQRYVGGGLAVISSVLLMSGIPFYAAVIAGFGLSLNSAAMLVQNNVKKLNSGWDSSIM